MADVTADRLSGRNREIDDGVVGRDDEPPPAEEVLDLGVLDEPGNGTPEVRPEPAGSRSLLPRRSLLAAGGLVVIGGALAAIASRRPGTPPKPTAASPSPPATSPSATTGGAHSLPPPVAVTELGHPLLGVTAGWDLFALGDDVLLRIHPASGRITRTALPPLGDAAVSLVPARGRILIHPTDYGQGYLVADDRPVAEMPPALNGGGPMLPGPDQDHVWVQTSWEPMDGSNRRRMQLLTLAGAPAGLTVAVPLLVGDPTPDGGGYLLFEGVGGVYRADAAGLSRLSGGALIAVGPPGWLTLDCDDQARCGTVLHGRNGTRHAVPVTLSPQAPSGVLSADGRTAALLDVGPLGNPGRAQARLVDLGSGARHVVDLALSPTGADGTLAWSPDGRWLFAIDVSGQVRAVDARTREVVNLVPRLPPVQQLAVRW